MTNHRLAAHAVSTVKKIRELRRGRRGAHGRSSTYRLAFRLLNPRALAPTVLASGVRDLIHPKEDRFLTARELARLQTFPDSYEFKGYRLDSYSARRNAPLCQIAQIGNAVPPRLAETLARSLRAQLFVDPGGFLDLQAARRVPRVVARLATAYPASRLGNKANPVDELVYILLSRQTTEKQYQGGYRSFRRAFPRWQIVLEASFHTVAAALKPLGLAKQKTKALRSAFRRMKADFGRITLAPLRCWPTWRALNYLCGLLGVNEKSAKCVLMYCFDRQVLPVDTHTLRVSRRLGVLGSHVPEWSAGRWLEMAVPPELRFDYHVRCVQHGRLVCRPRQPLCGQCCIRELCLRLGVP